MHSIITLRNPSEAEEVARLILQSHPDRRVFALHGDLGAGKTTLIKAFCAVLGVADATSSPSFAIVNEYRAASGDPVYHFDLYRLKDAGELDAIGFSEYVDSASANPASADGPGAYCFIEWPELADGLLPPDAVHLRISVAADGSRTITAG